MANLSDLLGIPHFSTSTGGTVKKDFLLEVADALGVRYPDKVTKDGLLARIWGAAQGREMPVDRLSPGSTVTNRVLEEIIDGIIENDIDARSVGFEQEGAEPGWLSFVDERRKCLRETTIREGRDSFRRSVLDAYGSQCTVTRTAVPAVLEAAHIVPYRGTQSNNVTNGLCLRRDIHSLFDRRLLTIDESDYRVILSDQLLDSTSYGHLEGTELHLPTKDSWPDKASLRMHREWATSGRHDA
jgi:hypothetical protein